eukprot:4254532-Amphidinium_carterae.2
MAPSYLGEGTRQTVRGKASKASQAVEIQCLGEVGVNMYLERGSRKQVWWADECLSRAGF